MSRTPVTHPSTRADAQASVPTSPTAAPGAKRAPPATSELWSVSAPTVAAPWISAPGASVTGTVPFE